MLRPRPGSVSAPPVSSPGDVDAGVELAELGEGAIDVSANRRAVTVRLPHARLFDARVDPAKS
ncbi:MAG: DUF4230 domain-containing protein [Actinomycetota bacterium]